MNRLNFDTPGHAFEPMTQYPQWVLWKSEPAEGGRWTKRPYNPRQLASRAAVDNPGTWGTYAAARSAYEQGGFDGVGFVFTPNDPFFFVDVDHALADGVWSAFSGEIINRFPHCAVETSQSGTGLHVFGTCEKPIAHRSKNKPLDLELYTEGRFAAMTGNHARGSAAVGAQAALLELVGLYLSPNTTQGTPANWTDEPVQYWKCPDSDDDLVEQARRDTSRFGARFAQHFDCDEASLAEWYPSENDVFDRSSADFALAIQLLWFTGKDCERTERLMRMSALAREKWERSDYLRERTILKALSKMDMLAIEAFAAAPLLAPDGQIVPLRKVEAPSANFVEPVDLWAKFHPPALPLGLLPPVIEQFALGQADLMGADPGGLAASALAVCGAAIPDGVRLQVKRHDDSWQESARIWVALVGMPSTKKSPVIHAAARPLSALDRQLAKNYARELEAYSALSKEEQRERPVPKHRRLKLEDTTIEAAQEVLKHSPDGVLSLQDELSGWFGSMDKYAGGRGAAKDRGFWLTSFNGGPYSVDRVSRGSSYIENLSVSMLGGIQPEAIRKLASDAVDDGLLQRLFPIVLRAATEGRDEPAPNSAALYESLVIRLNARPHVQLRFSDDALKVRVELEKRHLALQATETLNPKLAAHIGKYDGLFARLCVIWHCVEAGADAEVSVDTARRVGAFMHRFLLPHAVAFFAGVLGFSSEQDRLAAVAGHILAHGLQEVSPRDVQRGDRIMRGLDRYESQKVLEQLESLGWLYAAEGPRPSSVRWNVNPRCHQLFAERATQEHERRTTARKMISEIAAMTH